MISALSPTNIWKNPIFRVTLTEEQILTIQTIQSVAIVIFSLFVGLYFGWKMFKKEMKISQLYSQKQIYLKSNNQKEYFNCLKEIEKIDPVDIKAELAWCYYSGFGVTRDPSKAFLLFEQTVRERSSPYAERMLAHCYKESIGVDKNELKAFQLYEKAAQAGDGDAQVCLGHCYLYGQGVSKDNIKAFQWYERSSIAGNFLGKFMLAFCYQNGYGITENQKRASQLYKEVVESPLASEDFSSEYIADALYYLGITDINETQITRGLAPERIAEVLYYLGYRYRSMAAIGIGQSRGIGIPLMGDIRNIPYELAGVRLIKQAAKMGFVKAQLDLAHIYYGGSHVKKSLKKAFKWYTEAAQRGSSTAVEFLATRFDAMHG